MKTIDIVESNRMIAEFMGITFYGKTITEFMANGLNEMPKMEYHNKWSWLMPVVEKIAKFKYEDGEDYAYPRTFGMIDENGNFMVRLNRCALFHAPTLIEATYMAVVDFITWYNQQIKL